MTSYLRTSLENQAHVWLARPDNVMSSSSLGRHKDILSPVELQRYHRYIFDRDKHLFLVAHAALRIVLSKYEDFSPGEWAFEQNEHGRPEVAESMGLAGLRFNMSHSHGLVACLVSEQIDCGVDVERADRVNDPMMMAKRVFSPLEVGTLEACNTNDAKRARFIEYWTLKEAYIKAVGRGLSIPLQKFSLILDGDNPIRVGFHPDLKDDSNLWQFALRYPSPHHTLAVALQKGNRNDLPIVIRDMDI